LRTAFCACLPLSLRLFLPGYLASSFLSPRASARACRVQQVRQDVRASWPGCCGRELAKSSGFSRRYSP